MKLCNNRAPLEIKNKDKWIDVERRRWASLFRIPIAENAPPGFPPVTIHVQRALCAVEIAQPANLADCYDALYQSFWVEGNGNIGKPQGFGPILERVLGKDGAAEIMQQATSPEAKKRLIDNSDRAFQSGAFGAPWWECTNEEGEQEWFWGVDHMGQVIDFLGLDRESDTQRTGGKSGMRAML